ncbi:Laccase-2 [Grifola frondosa]|uniref:laccase n=1 Tax=Grifola frondosa TaxID=5627 RepID=A0A1C7M3R8_GRIFR|nr:Laccase-2 [Grifola frondosa]
MARFSLVSLSVALGLSVRTLASIGPTANLPIVNAVISPDGFSRATVLADGTFPGPLITGKKGDHFEINVIDELTNATMFKTTSIHWHGFFQHGTSWADGPAFVTQCPIASGNSFLYDFSVPDQAGEPLFNYFHLATQYCDGLRGAFVVYDPLDPLKHLYDVDNESTIITIADWYHTAAQLGPRIPDGPDSTLINGLGRYAGGPASDLAVISVQFGKRYRFRLISLSCDPVYAFSIDNHTMLHANQTIGNYWVRANPDSGVLGFAGGINSAILRYVGAPAEEPTITNQSSINPLNEVDLHALVNPGVPGKHFPGGVDLAINLEFSFNGTDFFVNNATFTPPSVPVLLQILSGTHRAQDLLPAGSVYSLPRNSSIEISMPGGVVDGGHPLHLHGHTFAVVRSAGSTVYNYDDPVLRDTVNIGGPGDNVTIRFETNNPGPWFLHCHIDFHLQAGFAIVFAEDIPDIPLVTNPPHAWDELCPIYNALDPSNH